MSKPQRNAFSVGLGAAGDLPWYRVLDPFPVESNFSLILCAQDNDRGDVTRIRIRINDTVIFEGENEFGRHGWYVREYPIPVEHHPIDIFQVWPSSPPRKPIWPE